MCIKCLTELKRKSIGRSSMKINNVNQSVLPLCFMSVLLGITTICPYKKNGVWIISNSSKLKVIHFLWFFLMNMCLIASSILPENKDKYYTGLAGFGIILTRGSLVGQAYLTHIFAIKMSNQYKDILKDLSLIDYLLKKNGVNINHNTHFYIEISELIGGVVFILLHSHGAVDSRNIARISTLPTTIFLFIYSVCICVMFGLRVFMLMALMLKRYWVINREVNALNLPLMQKDPKIITAKIENLIEIYFHLNSSVAKLNRACQIQSLPYFGILFAVNICMLFNTYFEYYIQKNLSSSFSWFQWFLIVWAGFLQHCYMFHFTINEAKRTGVILHKFLLEDLSPTLLQKMSLFSSQVLNSQLESTACGFFPIDGTLAYMFVGATFNYMIVMLQFEEGNNEHC